MSDDALKELRRYRNLSKDEKLKEGRRLAEAVASYFGWELHGCGMPHEGAIFFDPSGHAVETNRFGEKRMFSVNGLALMALARAAGAAPKFPMANSNKESS